MMRRFTTFAVLVVCGTATAADILPVGRTIRDALRDEIRRRPSTIAYYTFADLKTEGLQFVAGKGNGRLDFTTARWPEVRAVRLDRGWLQGPPADASDKGLAVACWFRCNGMGKLTDFRGKPAAGPVRHVDRLFAAG